MKRGKEESTCAPCQTTNDTQLPGKHFSINLDVELIIFYGVSGQ